jgi:hypothetical protein
VQTFPFHRIDPIGPFKALLQIRNLIGCAPNVIVNLFLRINWRKLTGINVFQGETGNFEFLFVPFLCCCEIFGALFNPQRTKTLLLL